MSILHMAANLMDFDEGLPKGQLGRFRKALLVVLG